MAQPNDGCAIVPVCVIGSQFVTPNKLEFIVDTNSKGNIVVTDINHKIILKIKPCNTAFHHQRLVLHADDTPIVMLRKKVINLYLVNLSMMRRIDIEILLFHFICS